MNTKYGIKTKKRPNLIKDLQQGDILQVGTDQEVIFTVVKIDNSEYLFIQTGVDASYIHSRGVMNQKIMDFEERNDAYFLILKGDSEI